MLSLVFGAVLTGCDKGEAPKPETGGTNAPAAAPAAPAAPAAK